MGDLPVGEGSRRRPWSQIGHGVSIAGTVTPSAPGLACGADLRHTRGVPRGRLLRIGLVIVVVVLAAAAAFRTFADDDGRYGIEGLSCPTNTVGRSAVDFQSIPVWASPEEGLSWLEQYHPSFEPDGWVLGPPGPDVVRWLRKTNDGDIVGIATLRRAGDGWTYDDLIGCGDEG